MPKYKHMTLDLRCQLYALRSIGESLRSIAKRLKLNVSTISREVKRNSGRRGYMYLQAERIATKRRKIASQQRSKMTKDLQFKINKRLYLGWSPEQISGRLKLEGISISHESIYRLVRKDKERGGSLYKQLRHAGKKYNKRLYRSSGRGIIKNRVDISQRPQVVDEKIRIGDWEADTVISAGSRTAILTVVDRSSKLVIIQKIKSKKADCVNNAIKHRMRSIKDKVLTITFDNGKEFAYHSSIAKSLGAKTYFATPYHSWERGLNEHTNGLIRQYLPKKLDFKNVSHKVIRKIENRLNSRPRKALNFRTPFEVFYQCSFKSPSVALHC